MSKSASRCALRTARLNSPQKSRFRSCEARVLRSVATRSQGTPRAVLLVADFYSLSRLEEGARAALLVSATPRKASAPAARHRACVLALLLHFALRFAARAVAESATRR